MVNSLMKNEQGLFPYIIWKTWLNLLIDIAHGKLLKVLKPYRGEIKLCFVYNLRYFLSEVEITQVNSLE